MEQVLAEQKVRELRIDVTQVARESWELILLKGLFDSSSGRDLIFKGGTALRLAHGSPRFSEDLDFSLIHDRLKGKFRGWVEKIIAPFPELALTDFEEKRHTYSAEMKATLEYLPLPFRVKVEISRRKFKDCQWKLQLLSPPVSTVQVLAQVGALEQVYQDKICCLKGRAKPKDLFDLWYTSQKLKIPYTPPPTTLKKKHLIRDLRKYLPKDFWPAVEELIP